MKTEKLLPAGIEEETRQELHVLQKRADEIGVLLPCEFNQNIQTNENGNDNEILMPPQF